MSRRAFTLIELLAVIAVVAILASLLLPILARSRMAAYDTVCKNNLRQLGIALASYTSDFRAYPYFSDGNSGGSTQNYWPELLGPYSGAIWDLNLYKGLADAAGKLYLCPGYARIRPLYTVPLPEDWSSGHGLGAYAYNQYGVWNCRIPGPRFLGLGGLDDPTARGILPPTRECEVLRPSLMVAITDAAFGTADDQSLWGCTDFSDVLGVEGYELESGMVVSTAVRQLPPSAKQNIVSAIRTRHSGRWNVVFCDGHVRAYKTKELFDWRDDAVLSLRNKDNLPHRDLQFDPPSP